MVDVITQSAGLSAEEIEHYVTIPIETQTAGLPNLRTIPTISLYGLSDLKLQVSFDFTYEQALQQVLNRLSQLPALRNGAQPRISHQSDWGGLPLERRKDWPASNWRSYFGNAAATRRAASG